MPHWWRTDAAIVELPPVFYIYENHVGESNVSCTVAASAREEQEKILCGELHPLIR